MTTAETISLLNFPDDPQHFLKAHKGFFAALPTLQATLKQMFDKALEKFNNAPENTDEIVRRAEMVVLWLVRAAYDDFLAVVILAQQGMGFSAMIMVRSALYREISEPEAHQATMRGHGLAVSAMKLLAKSFDLKMGDDVLKPGKTLSEVLASAVRNWQRT